MRTAYDITAEIEHLRAQKRILFQEYLREQEAINKSKDSASDKTPKKKLPRKNIKLKKPL